MSEIKALKLFVSKNLHKDFIDLYTENNGQIPDTFGFFENYSLLTFTEITSHWTFMKSKLDDGLFKKFEEKLIIQKKKYQERANNNVQFNGTRLNEIFLKK